MTGAAFSILFASLSGIIFALLHGGGYDVAQPLGSTQHPRLKRLHVR